MRLECTYICVKDIEKSSKFYQLLLQQNPTYLNENRWISFTCGNTFALYNDKYDQQLISNRDTDTHFNEEFINDFKNTYNDEKKNSIVVFNFIVEDIKSEYQRIKDLKIGQISELMFVNIACPYWYFTIQDPDGNTLEIAEMR